MSEHSAPPATQPPMIPPPSNARSMPPTPLPVEQCMFRLEGISSKGRSQSPTESAFADHLAACPRIVDFETMANQSRETTGAPCLLPQAAEAKMESRFLR